MRELNDAFIELKNFGIYLNDIIIPLIIALLSIIILLLIRKLSFRLINKWSHESGLNLSEIILSSIKTPSIQWCFALGLYLGISISEIPEKYLLYINKLIVVVIIFSVTLAIANLTSRVIQYHIQKSNLSFPATGLVFSVLGAAILTTGFLLILSKHGLLDEPQPVVRFIPGFSESSLDFKLICSIQEFRLQNSIQHELRKRILKRFREEGIEIPFPQRTVYLRKEEV